MLDLHALAARWDDWYNAPVFADPVIGYLVVSVARLLIGWAAWLMLRALTRYVAAAFPPPHTAANAVYWLRWWLWLRLREFPMLKIGAFAVAALLILQIPAGMFGALGTATRYLLLIYAAFFALLIGVAQLLNHLTRRILHPAD